MAEEVITPRTFKALVAEQKKTTIAIEKSMMSAEERAEFEAREEERFKKRSEASKKGHETRQANLLAAVEEGNQPKPVSAAQEEANKDQQNYLFSTFDKFLGKDSFLSKGLGGIGDSLKKKVSGGLDSLFGLLKKGVFLAALLGVTKFLQSQLWQDILDKYLPILGDALQSVYDTLKKVVDGFFVKGEDGKYTFSATAGLSNIMSMISGAFTDWIKSLKDGFYDENDEFTLTGGIKNLAGDFATILASLTAFGLLLAPKLFFGTLFQIGKGGGGLAVRALGKIATSFGSIFTSLTGFNTSLSETGAAMDSKVKTSKTKGIFGKAGKSKFGILARFGRLFGKIGLFGGAIALAGAGMSGLLNTEKISGVFSDTAKGIGSGFKSLFSNVAKFGTNLATSASNMVTRLGTAVKTGVFSVANGIGSKFNSLFNVLSDFGSSIAKVASKATAKAASVVAKSLDDVAKIGAKTVTAVAKPATKLSAEALDALRGTGQFAIKPKVPAVKLNKTQLDYLRGTGEGAFDVVKTTAATTKAAAATAEEVVQKSIAKSLIKKIPLISLFAGTGFAIDRLSKGEYSKAFLEFASGVAGVFPGFGTAGSLAIDAGLLADDLGISIEDAKKLILANGGTVARAKMGQSPGAMGGQLPKASTAPAYEDNISRGDRGARSDGGTLMAPTVVQTNSFGGAQHQHFNTSISPDNFVDQIIKIQ